MAQWYETLFANYGKTYDKECFTQGTVGEADFVERELKAERAKKFLDIGCGCGRHAIELARRGYRVIRLAPTHPMGTPARRIQIPAAPRSNRLAMPAG